jgi:hypothetical protein
MSRDTVLNVEHEDLYERLSQWYTEPSKWCIFLDLGEDRPAVPVDVATLTFVRAHLQDLAPLHQFSARRQRRPAIR